MANRASEDGATAGLVIGCLFAGSLIIISVILLIWELLRPDNTVTPAPEPPPRDERFYGTILGVSDEIFNKSHFLKYYNNTERYPSNSTIIDSLLSLEGINDRSHPVFQSIQSEHHSYNALKTFSSDHIFGSSEFFRYVNKQLRNDDKSSLRQLMPFIRRATAQINEHGPSSNHTVYRGMTLTPKEVHYFSAEKLFRFPGFTSASAQRGVASNFGNVVFEIQIDAGCHQVRNITNISCYPNEQEWLFSPYSRFRVRENRNNVIVLQSLDNMT